MEYTRLSRRKRTNADLGLVTGMMGLCDLVDNMVKTMCRINDIEYDYICEVAIDAELSLLTLETLTYKDKRDLLIGLQRIMKLYHEANA